MSAQHSCKNCGHTFTDKFCNSCGEKLITSEDRLLKHFLADLINAFTFADSKLWRTIKTMFIAPGKYSHDFVAGIRIPYMKPISIFFLANLIYFFSPSFNTFNSNLNTQLSLFNHSKIAMQMVKKEVAARGIEMKDYRIIYDQKTNELSKLLLVIMSAVFGFLFWPIHIGSNKKLLADHFTFGLEAMTFITLFCVILLTVTFSLVSFFGLHLATEAILSSCAGILLIYFFYRAEKIFYGFTGFRRILNTIFCFCTVLISLSLYRGFLFFITFWSL